MRGRPAGSPAGRPRVCCQCSASSPCCEAEEESEGVPGSPDCPLPGSPAWPLADSEGLPVRPTRGAGRLARWRLGGLLRRRLRQRARAEALEVAGRRLDEGLHLHVAGLAEADDDLLHATDVLRQRLAVVEHRGRVARAAEEDRALGRDGDRAAALGGGELQRAAGALQGDRVDRLRGVVRVEDLRGEDRGTLGVRLRLGDHHGVLDLDRVDRHLGVVRPDAERLRVHARAARGERGEGERDGGDGEGAASKARDAPGRSLGEAHGGGISLNVRAGWGRSPRARRAAGEVEPAQYRPGPRQFADRLPSRGARPAPDPPLRGTRPLARPPARPAGPPPYRLAVQFRRRCFARRSHNRSDQFPLLAHIPCE